MANLLLRKRVSGEWQDVAFGATYIPRRLTVDIDAGRSLAFEESHDEFWQNVLEAEDEIQLWDNDTGRLVFQGTVLDSEGRERDGATESEWLAEGLKRALDCVRFRAPNNEGGTLRVVFNAPRDSFEYHEDRYERTVGQIVRYILKTMESSVRGVLNQPYGLTYTGNVDGMTVVPPELEFNAETVKSALDKVMRFQPEFSWIVDLAYVKTGFGEGGFGEQEYGSPCSRIIRFIDHKDAAENRETRLSLLGAGNTPYGYGEGAYGEMLYGSPQSQELLVEAEVNNSTRHCYTAVTLQGDDELEAVAIYDPEKAPYSASNPTGNYIVPDWDTGYEDGWNFVKAITPGNAGTYGRVYRFFRLVEGSPAFPVGSRVLSRRGFSQQIVLLTDYYLGQLYDYASPVSGTVTPDGHIRLDVPIHGYQDWSDPEAGYRCKKLLMRFLRRSLASSEITVRVPASGWQGSAYVLRGTQREFTWYSGNWKRQRFYGNTTPKPPIELLADPWKGADVLWDNFLCLPDWSEAGQDPLELIGKTITVSGVGTYSIIQYAGSAIRLEGFPGAPDYTGYVINFRNDSQKMGQLAEMLLAEFQDVRYVGQFTLNCLDFGLDLDRVFTITDGKTDWVDATYPMRARPWQIVYDLVAERTTVHLTKESELSADELARRIFHEDRSRLFEVEHFQIEAGAPGGDTGGGGTGQPQQPEGDQEQYNIWL